MGCQEGMAPSESSVEHRETAQLRYPAASGFHRNEPEVAESGNRLGCFTWRQQSCRLREDMGSRAAKNVLQLRPLGVLLAHPGGPAPAESVIPFRRPATRISFSLLPRRSCDCSVLSSARTHNARLKTAG